MRQCYLERTSSPLSVGGARVEQTVFAAESRMTRSQEGFSTRGASVLPLRASSCLARTSERSNARSPSERLTNWMARSSTAVCRSSGSRVATPEHVDHVKHTKSSLLRSKTCPTPIVQTDLTELHRKQKMFAHKCKTYSTSSVLLLNSPDGGSVHGFLTGARYNSARTLDTNSLKRHGVYVSRRNISNVFANSSHGSRQLQKKTVFGDAASLERHTSVHEIQSNDSTASIERELDEVFGPNQDSSSSNSENSFLETEGLKSEESVTLEQSETLETVGKDKEQCDVFINLETEDTIVHSNHTDITSEHRGDQNPTFETNEKDDSDQTKFALSCDIGQKTSSQDSKPTSQVSVSSSSNEFDSEDEFISQEAHKLTLEILETECRNHISSLASVSSSSIGNISSSNKSTEDMTIDIKEEKSKENWNHFQTSQETLSTDTNRETSCSHVLLSPENSTGNPGTDTDQYSRRVKSAGSNPARKVDSNSSPISGGLCSRSLFIDMSSLHHNT